MPQYRVHLLGQDGHFINGVILDRANDAAAIEAAKKYADGYDIEVWDRSRRVATLPGKREVMRPRLLTGTSAVIE